MKTRRFAYILCLTTVALAVILPQLAAGAPPGGGGKNVTVTAATPNEANQAQDVFVTVSGSGFDNGSQVSYLVTGTTDASQVEVISVEYVSPSELKTHIKVKNNAVVNDYDIEVRTLSGRKGKGTTIFRVNQSSEACVDSEFPAIAYMSLSPVLKKKGRLTPQGPYDLNLTGDGGCTRYELLSDYPHPPDGSLLDLKFVTRNGLGLASWIEWTGTNSSGVSIHRIKAVFFNILAGGDISPAQPVPVVLYEVVNDSNDDVLLRTHDTRLDAEGLPHIVLTDITVSSKVRSVRTITPASGLSEVLFTGDVHFLDADGNPYIVAGDVRWSPNGDALYIPAFRTDVQGVNDGIARIIRSATGWQTPTMLVVNHQNDQPLEIAGLSPDGLLAYGYLQSTGPHTTMNTGIIDPELCVAVSCDVLDGAPLDGVLRQSRPQAWTSAGTLLFWLDAGVLGEWSDPEFGAESGFRLPDIDSRKVDTSL